MQAACSRCGGLIVVDNPVDGGQAACPSCGKRIQFRRRHSNAADADSNWAGEPPPISLPANQPIQTAPTPSGFADPTEPPREPPEQWRTSGRVVARRRSHKGPGGPGVIVAAVAFPFIAGAIWWLLCAKPQGDSVGGDDRSAAQSPTVRDTSGLSTRKPVAPVFGDPERASKALSSQGLTPKIVRGTGRIWGKPEEGSGYFCICDELEVTPGGYEYVGDVPNNISYYCSSEFANQVQRVELNASMFNEKNARPVIREFKRLAPELFGELGLRMPSGLELAIERELSKRFEEDYGTVELVRSGYKMGHGLMLTITPRFK